MSTPLVDQDTEPPDQTLTSEEEDRPLSSVDSFNASLSGGLERFETATAPAAAPHLSPWGPTRRAQLFGDAAEKEWNDWRWQLRNSIKSFSALSRFVNLSEQEKAADGGRRNALPISITPYYMTLIHPWDVSDPIRRTVVPSIQESIVSPGELEDPLGEDEDSPVPGIVHRYPDRVLLLATNRCSVYCRYCTRSRVVGKRSSEAPIVERWERCIEYIAQHREVRDVLVSGGDPLLLSNNLLDLLLGRLRRIRHVEILRIGTKVPIVLPQRVTSSLARMLARHHPLWMNLHVTHPRELTDETSRACRRLADAGIPLGSQTVLLSGVNDDAATMRALYKGLLRIRVRPYYLYQCDRIKGSAHFSTPVSKGLEIIRGLRGFTSGLAVPHYVIDAPGGGGKIPLLPEYCVGVDQDGLVLRSYSGRIHHYPNPASQEPASETVTFGREEIYS